MATTTNAKKGRFAAKQSSNGTEGSAKTIKRERAKIDPPSEIDRARGAVSLRPGMLVSLSARLRGGVSYQRTDKRSEVDGRAKIDEWETERRIEDRAEFDRGIKTRNKCRSIISASCIRTAFGLICLKDQQERLDAAIAESTRMASEFNKSARHSTIEIYLIRGRIEQTDTEAMRAICGEIKGLIATMKDAIGRADVDGIRQAALQARQISQMLDASQQQEVKGVVTAAREAAKTIVQQVQKKGEDAKKVIVSLNLEALDLNRFAWLDVDDEAPSSAGRRTAPVAVEMDVEDEE